MSHSSHSSGKPIVSAELVYLIHNVSATNYVFKFLPQLILSRRHLFLAVFSNLSKTFLKYFDICGR